MPGFKQLFQMRQMKNMNLDDIFGNMPGGGGPGMPPGDQGAALQQALQAQGLPKGFTPPGMSSGTGKARVVSKSARNKAKSKRKAARKARKRR